jgi:hypothetical protein
VLRCNGRVFSIVVSDYLLVAAAADCARGNRLYARLPGQEEEEEEEEGENRG